VIVLYRLHYVTTFDDIPIKENQGREKNITLKKRVPCLVLYPDTQQLYPSRAIKNILSQSKITHSFHLPASSPPDLHGLRQSRQHQHITATQSGETPEERRCHPSLENCLHDYWNTATEMDIRSWEFLKTHKDKGAKMDSIFYIWGELCPSLLYVYTLYTDDGCGIIIPESLNTDGCWNGHASPQAELWLTQPCHISTGPHKDAVC
jgi:hypothetical protein